MGFSDVLFQDTPWVLTSLDDGTVIEGQFPPQALTENVAGVWAEAGTLGLDHPIIQFVRGALETITLEAKVWANHQGVLGLGEDNIKEVVDQLRNLPRRDSRYGRPMVWLLSVGDEFSQQVVVRSVGGIRYDRLRPWNKSLRGAMFSIEFIRYIEYTLEDSASKAESLIVSVQQGDFYERIAAREYGDPNLGDALRRRNPDMLDLEAGDQLHIPPVSIMRGELSLTPASLPFKANDATAQLLRDCLALRGADYTTFRGA
jgi:hypothetical protein